MDKINNVGGLTASGKTSPINVAALEASKLAQSLGNPVLSKSTVTNDAAKEAAVNYSQAA